jgi:hypothetical protein
MDSTEIASFNSSSVVACVTVGADSIENAVSLGTSIGGVACSIIESVFIVPLPSKGRFAELFPINGCLC